MALAAPARRPAAPVDLLLVLGGFLLTLLVVTVVQADPRLGSAVPLLIVGGLGFVGLVYLAFTRFHDFLVALFVVRTALDYFKPEGGGPIEPPTVVGGLTVVAGIAWLWQQQRQGRLVETSRLTLALIGLSVLTFINPLFAFSKAEAIRSAIRILSFTVLFAVFEQWFRTDPTARKRMLWAICGSLVMPALVAFQQFTRNEQTDIYIDVSRVQGTFTHPNPFGTYLVMMMLVGIVLTMAGDRRWRVASVVVALLSTGLLLLTYTRVAWVAAILGVVVLGVRLDRRILRALLVGAVLVVVLVPSVTTRLADLDDAQESGAGDPNSLAWRVGYWQDLLPLGLSEPVGGIGLESTQIIRDEDLEPHNVFVQAFIELGVPGLLAVIIILVAATNEVHRSDYWARDRWERALSALAAAVGIGFAAQLFSENLLTQPVSLWYLGLILAAALANGWEGGVAPWTIRGELSLRQRLALLLSDERRQPSDEAVQQLEGVDLRLRVREILARNLRRRNVSAAERIRELLAERPHIADAPQVPGRADASLERRVAAIFDRNPSARAASGGAPPDDPDGDQASGIDGTSS